MIGILFNVIKESGISLVELMGENVLKAFTNYHNFIITLLYDHLVVPGDILGSRNKINVIPRNFKPKNLFSN
nr:hypothetical protein Iba_chr12cCG12670 [Ipomoea batatas]